MKTLSTIYLQTINFIEICSEFQVTGINFNDILEDIFLTYKNR